jgi:hypothetical protein
MLSHQKLRLIFGGFAERLNPKRKGFRLLANLLTAFVRLLV